MRKAKKSYATTVRKKAPAESSKELQVLKLENNVPMPERGTRDPEFVERVSGLLAQMKVNQSFVVPKKKAHTVKKVTKSDTFNHLTMRMSVIKPDNKFVRIWRLS